MEPRDAVQVSVLLAEVGPAQLQELRDAGLDVIHTLTEIGVVTGSMDPARIDDLRRIPGVTAVEVARKVRLA